jgi:hypothetical protein
MSVKELELAVRQLPAEDFAAFAQWFEEYAAAQWDAQIERDARAGKLDALAAKAKSEFESGKCTEL